MTMNNLQDALIHEMQDLLNAEQQLTKALPKLAKQASDEDLRQAFEHHLEQTQQQIQRLEQAFDSLGAKAKGIHCDAMAGIVDEAESILKEKADPEVLDAMLIGAAQKAEHYEIATYGTVRTWASQLGLKDCVKLLEQTLHEEKETDEKLTKIAQRINKQAEQAE